MLGLIRGGLNAQSGRMYKQLAILMGEPAVS